MENLKLFLSEKSQFELVEKIKNENKNKNRTRASPFQFSEDGKQEIFLSGLMPYPLYAFCQIYRYVEK